MYTHKRIGAQLVVDVGLVYTQQQLKRFALRSNHALLQKAHKNLYTCICVCVSVCVHACNCAHTNIGMYEHVACRHPYLLAFTPDALPSALQPCPPEK